MTIKRLMEPTDPFNRFMVTRTAVYMQILMVVCLITVEELRKNVGVFNFLMVTNSGTLSP